MSVSGNVRNTANTLEVLALIKAKAKAQKVRRPKKKRRKKKRRSRDESPI